MLTLITGMPGSGKSLIAETIVLNSYAKKRFYIATMHKYDKESEKKVKRHQQMRAEKNFFTVEKYVNISSVPLQDNAVYLLECITNLLANEMFDKDGSKDNCVKKILSDINKINSVSKDFIIVTNQISADGNVYDAASTQYIKNICNINNEIAKLADVVIECVAGIPIYLKGEKYGFI